MLRAKIRELFYVSGKEASVASVPDPALARYMAHFSALSRVPEKRKSDQIDEDSALPRKRASLDNQPTSRFKSTYWTVQW